jgi:hypothetical protein
MKVHLLNSPSQEAINILKANLIPGIDISMGIDFPPNQMYEILVGGSPEREYISGSSTIYTLIIPFACIPAKTRELMLEFSHIKVFNLHHNAAPTAELAIALLLSAAKHIINFDQSLRNNDWTIRYNSSPSILLEGKNALILGYGEIGRRVGNVCQSLGINTTAIRRNNKENDQDLPIKIHYPDELHKLLADTDILIISLPLTKET